MAIKTHEGGMLREIANLGLERQELARSFGQALIGGEAIPYEPKELASIVTTLRGYAPKRYLSIEGNTGGGRRFISNACDIPETISINPKDSAIEIRKSFRNAHWALFDLVSIDPRGLPLSADEIWRFLQGGKEVVTEFGKGAPKDYGPRKVKDGTIVIFNLADKATKDLYFQVRTMDNKLHQSLYAGMVKL